MAVGGVGIRIGGRADCVAGAIAAGAGWPWAIVGIHLVAVEASATRRMVTGSQGMPCCQASWARFVACQFVYIECLVRLSAARHIPSGVIAIHDISYDGLPPRLIRPTGLTRVVG